MLHNHFTIYINRRIFNFKSILSLHSFSQIVTDLRFPSRSGTEIDKFVFLPWQCVPKYAAFSVEKSQRRSCTDSLRFNMRAEMM